MSEPLWLLLLGTLLVVMVLTGTVLSRLFLSSAMVYLGVGVVLGPTVLGAIEPDPILHADVLARVAEVALLISLFSVGLKMGGVPLFDRRWLLPIRLAFISMAITVALITIIGVYGLGFSLGASVLLGGILAPTDPVLASGVQTDSGADPDRLRFSLAGEGGLNDGTAFPFVLLGLGLLEGGNLGAYAWRWWAIDLIWATIAGLLVGAACGTLVGRLVVYLRTRHQHAVGLDEFLSLGLVAIAYGAAMLCLASGFLAVFSAGLALQRVKERPLAGTESLGVTPLASGHAYDELAIHSHHASAAMTHAVQGFNQQLEKLAEPAIVLLVGGMLSYLDVTQIPPATLWWFIPLLFVVLRTCAVYLGTWGERMKMPQRVMISWFGIRGVGSVFYLVYAIHHGVSNPLAQQLITLTLSTVAVSIIVHGASVLPLMSWYVRGKRS